MFVPFLMLAECISLPKYTIYYADRETIQKCTKYIYRHIKIVLNDKHNYALRYNVGICYLTH